MGNDEMTFWEHLDVLRNVLLRIIVLCAILFVVLIIAMPHIFDTVILAPCSDNFLLYRLLDFMSRFLPAMPSFATGQFEVALVNIQLASQFFVHMSTALWLSVVLIFPYILYQLWQFISPALYPEENKKLRAAFMWSNLFFYLGLMVGYFVVFPLTLRFLSTYQLSTLVPNQISLDSYMSNFLSLTFAMGIIFQLPLLCKLLSVFGLIDRSFFMHYRRHAIVVLLIVAAFITPSGDPFTLVVVFLPIYAIYEISALFVVKGRKYS